MPAPAKLSRDLGGVLADWVADREKPCEVQAGRVFYRRCLSQLGCGHL